MGSELWRMMETNEADRKINQALCWILSLYEQICEQIMWHQNYTSSRRS